MARKIKLLVVGDGVAPTGFSRVLHSVVDRFNPEEYEITWLAVNHYGDPHNYSHNIYPAMGNGNFSDPYGYSRLEDMCIKIAKPDVIFFLNDIWIVDAYVEQLKAILGTWITLRVWPV